ncbi:MAG: hypothetical protein LBR67_08505 [Dysgonamonadaceae bacterium]|nr:hypothetical protein [Dysgonamonadaceae bacterium]
MIPCYHEPDVHGTLNSLLECVNGNFVTEILLVINSYQFNDNDIKEANRRTYRESLDFAARHNNPHFRLIPLLIEDLPGHQSGAGIPRKLGMDEALCRFDRIGRNQGIIVSLDADCTVDTNYLTEIYRLFHAHDLCSATIAFHHPTEHLPETDPVRKAATIYENYLRYYRAALEYCGYPYAYYTIGSAIAVRCETYARAGGMSKLQAGEDFYFMQKVFPLGKTRFIDTTCVYPAARLSDRVPFGTGPELIKLTAGAQPIKTTYSVESFQLLKTFFCRIDRFYHTPTDAIADIISELPDPLKAFLENETITDRLEEINRNTNRPEAFRKRFFNYFNAFKILKYLNFVHPRYFAPVEVNMAIDRLKVVIRNEDG